MQLQEWTRAKNKGHKVNLPSGLTVTLVMVQVPDLLERGEIPPALDRAVLKFLYGEERNERSLESYRDFMELVTFVAGKSIKDEGVDAKELPWADRIAIWSWQKGWTSAVQPFRESKKPVGTVRAK